MAIRVMEISLALTLASMLFARHTLAQSLSCTTTAMNLAPCLGYITRNVSTPSSTCCTQLDNVVKSQARCLCNLLNGSAPIFGISINRTQALALPGACKVQTPNVSRCNATAPVESPTPKAPAVPSTPKTPSVPKVPSGGKGSNTVPPGEYSGGSTYKSTRSTVFSALCLVLSISSIAL